MPERPLFCVGTGNSMNPSERSRPILLAMVSVNHTSVPMKDTDTGPLFEVGIGVSVSAAKLPSRVSVIFPSLFPWNSVNHTALERTETPIGSLLGVGIGNSVKAPAGVNRPILWALDSVNHTDPESTAIPTGPLDGVGIENSVTTPSGVTRPILFALNSVNQIASETPSYAIPRGPLFAVGIANSTTSPDGPRRPTLLAANSVNHHPPLPKVISRAPATGDGMAVSLKIPVATLLPNARSEISDSLSSKKAESEMIHARDSAIRPPCGTATMAR